MINVLHKFVDITITMGNTWSNIMSHKMYSYYITQKNEDEDMIVWPYCSKDQHYDDETDAKKVLVNLQYDHPTIKYALYRCTVQIRSGKMNLLRTENIT